MEKFRIKQHSIHIDIPFKILLKNQKKYKAPILTKNQNRGLKKLNSIN